MSPSERIPLNQFDAELRLVRRLVARLPWQRGDETDRGLRAAYRRWTPGNTLGTPPEASVEMTAPLWARVAGPAEGLTDDATLRAVRHAAFVLHLVALGADEGAEAPNVGSACRRADVADGRFVRLMHAPERARLEVLGRAFRRFRQAGVRVRLVADDAADWSRYRTLDHSSRDDLAALLAFLFTDRPERAIARWAAAFFGGTAPDAEAGATADAEPLATEA